jgi:pimeloyl-ACP methyl ester carboxylesterase
MYFQGADGAQLYYEDHGAKGAPPIFLLHGWGVSSVFFSEQIPILVKNGYRVITWDWRGHGKSSKWNGRLKFKSHEELLEIIYDDYKGLLAHVEVDRPYVILGHSAGAGVGLSIALANPDEMVALVILNSSYVLAETFTERLAWNFIPNLLEASYNPLFRIPYNLFLRGTIPFVALALNKPIKKVQTWINDLASIEKTVLMDELVNLKQYNLYDKLSRIQIPCLIIAGDLDVLTPLKRSRILHAQLPNSELHVIRNTGHLSMVEKSKEVNQILLKFLKREYPVKH